MILPFFPVSYAPAYGEETGIIAIIDSRTYNLLKDTELPIRAHEIILDRSGVDSLESEMDQMLREFDNVPDFLDWMVEQKHLDPQGRNEIRHQYVEISTAETITQVIVNGYPVRFRMKRGLLANQVNIDIIPPDGAQTFVAFVNGDGSALREGIGHRDNPDDMWVDRR